MSLCAAFGFLAALADFWGGAGSFCKIMAQSGYGIGYILIAAASAGVRGKAGFGAGGFCDNTGVIVPQRCTIGFAAISALFGRGAACFAPTMSLCVAFGFLAALADFWGGAGGSFPIMVKSICFIGDITVAAAAGMDGVTIFCASGGNCGGCIAMHMLQGWDYQGLCFAADRAGVQHFAIGGLRCFTNDHAIVPAVPQFLSGSMTTDGTGLGSGAGGIGIGMARGTDIVGTIGILATATAMGGKALFGAGGGGYHAGVVVLQRLPNPITANGAALCLGTSGFLPLVAQCVPLGITAGLACFGRYAGGLLPCMTRGRHFLGSIAVAAAAGVGGEANLRAGGVGNHCFGVVVLVVQRRNLAGLRFIAGSTGIEDFTGFFLSRFL